MTQGVHTDRWIRRFHPASDATIRLVCFPHAGGSASFFFPLSHALPPSVEMVAIQYPGRQDRRTEPCLTSIEELAGAIMQPLLTWLDKPVALFGHSMGASIGFEVAYRLEDEGVAPAALFASSRRAPSRHRDEEQMHLRDDKGLIAEIKALNGTDVQAIDDEDILRMVLPAIRADYRVAETYRWQPKRPLRTPIHAHIGESDPKVTPDEAQAWQTHTTAAFSLTTYPGGHFYINNHVPQLIQAISSELGVATG